MVPATPVAPAPVAAAPAENTPQPPAARVAESRHAIAVLPFVNMSGDAENEYFSDGISEEILNLLSKLPQLKVASRTSAFNFKGKEVSIPTVARELGVSTVLEGSVRRAGDHVRITAQLIDAESDSHLWSETYDREMKDVFAIQDDIAHSIVKALQVTLTPQERRSIQFVATSDPEAYDYYLRGRNYMYSMARRDYEHAIRMFEQAIGVDSKYALAYAGIADAYSHMYRYIEATQENVEHANRASEQAVVLDPRFGRSARLARPGAVHQRAIRRCRSGSSKPRSRCNPNLFEAWYYYGLACSSQGDSEKAAELYIKASEVNPADFQAPMFLAQAYASLGRKQDEMRVRLGALGTLERHLRAQSARHARALFRRAEPVARRRAREGDGTGRTGAAAGSGRAGRALQRRLLLRRARAIRSAPSTCWRRRSTLGWGDRAWMENDSDLDPLHARTALPGAAGAHPLMAVPGQTATRTGFFAELRRRRVIRVAVVYAVVGWIVIEVASTMLPGLNLPGWTVTFVIALVVLGFPIAVIMGWMFDIGPEAWCRSGRSAAPPADSAAGDAEARPRACGRFRRSTPRGRRADRKERRTIAVLPFVNMSGDAENEYFSDGISEEILNLLTKLPQLKVVVAHVVVRVQGQGGQHPDGGERTRRRHRARGQRAPRRRPRAHHRAADRDRKRFAPVVGDLRSRDQGRVRDPGRHRAQHRRCPAGHADPKERRALQNDATADPTPTIST